MDENLSDLLIAVAHPSEAEAASEAVRASGSSCEILLTGVGGMAMSWALQKRFSSGPAPSLVINAGIAGSYTGTISPGEAVMPVTDCFADMGVDDNGTFVSVFRANLADPDAWPFRSGRIHCTGRWVDQLARHFRTVSAATVNMASGSLPVITRIRREWDPEVETMEGAWFAYSCSMHRLEYLCLRTISNMVEPRNVKNWNIPLALERLGTALADMLRIISKP